MYREYPYLANAQHDVDTSRAFRNHQYLDQIKVHILDVKVQMSQIEGDLML